MVGPMLRRLVVGVSLGILAVFVATPVQAAEWCLHDPALHFDAPHSKLKITVYAMAGVQGVDNAWALEKAHVDIEAKPGNGTGLVLVRVRTNIPQKDHHAFSTVLLVSSRPYGGGTIFGVVMGRSGQTMQLLFSMAYAGSQSGP
jgi:hypothetical protein